MIPPLVYLDTQDYSRFGDVLRGCSDKKTETLFEKLVEIKQNREAIFAISMPILSELLQYDVNFPEIAAKKAEAVEILCDGASLVTPSEIIAAQTSHALRKPKAQTFFSEGYFLSQRWEWYPDVSDVLSDMKVRMKIEIQQVQQGMPNRKSRRVAGKVNKINNIDAFINAAAPLFTARYGIPAEILRSSLGKLLIGKIEEIEASRIFFSHVCKPTNFISYYFERRILGESLQNMMRQLGDDIAKSYRNILNILDNYVELGLDKKDLEKDIWQKILNFGSVILKMGAGDHRRFDINPYDLMLLEKDAELLSKIPAAKIFSQVVLEYFMQVSGRRGGNPSVERSFGGDLIHSLYLPHVDIWRGDRRFSNILTNVLVEYKSKICSRINDFPEMIYRFPKNNNSAVISNL